jgi:glycosyltransferase involved in cell wall biosynthesis
LSPRPDIALISPYPALGTRHGGHSGVASYCSNLAHGLVREGADVTVIAPVDDRSPAAGLDGGVRVRRSFRPGAAALPTAVGAALATGARTIHLQHETFLYGGPSSIPGIVPALTMARRRGGAVVTMHHVVEPAEVDRDFMRMHQVTSPVLATRAGLAGLRSAISRLAGEVIVHEPLFAHRVPGARVVPHGVEQLEPPAREDARAALGLDDRLIALCFGFVAPYKGLELAIKGSALAGDRVRLVVAGGDHPRLGSREPYRRTLRHRLLDAAAFTGRVPEEEVGLWFAAADVALFMYPRPFAASGALALALAHGTPPLFSPALGAAVGAPAALTVAAEPAALARRLQALAGDRERLARMADAGAELARGRSWPEVARMHLSIYGEEVSEHGSATDRTSDRTVGVA